MTRENLTKAIGDISDKYLVEAMDGIADTMTENSGEVIEMKKIKHLKTAIAAIAICTLFGGLGTGVYAAMRHFGILDFAGPATVEVTDPNKISEVTDEIQKETDMILNGDKAHGVHNEIQAANNTIYNCDVIEEMYENKNITVVFEMSAKESGKYLFIPEDGVLTDKMSDWGYESELSYEEYASQNNLTIVYIGGGILNRDELGITVVTADFKPVSDDIMDVFLTCGVTEEPKEDEIGIVATGRIQNDEKIMRCESYFKLK